jgi:hypothetical protein
MSDESPKPRKRKKPSGAKDSKQEDIDIKDLLQEVLKVRINESKEHKKTADIHGALVSTIGEFLNCFMLIGYDNEGHPLALTKASTPLESDALHSLLMKFFSIHMGKHTQQYGGDDF